MKNIALFILLSLFIHGCASTQSEIIADRQPTVSKKEKALSLGIIGGGLLLERLADTNEEKALAKDIVKYGFGFFAGQSRPGISSAMYREHVANQKAQFASEEDYLSACIQEAKRINHEIRKYNATLEEQFGELEEDVNTLLSQYRDGQISKAQLQDAQQEVQQVLDEAEKRLERAQDEVMIQREVRKREQNQSQRQLAELDVQIKQLEESIQEFDTTITKLATIRQMMTL